MNRKERDAARGRNDYDASPADLSSPEVYSGSGRVYDRLSRELVLISFGFVMIVVLAWAVMSGALTDEEGKRSGTNWLGVAQVRLKENRLTEPPDDNALDAYLQAQELAVGSSAVKSGLETIPKRYLAMINRLIDAGDLELAEKTLGSAARVIPHASDDYAYALAEARARLENAVREMSQRRQAARSTAENYEPLTVFQDYLKDGTLGPKMVVIPGGTFVLGSPEDERNRDPDEGPAHPVSVERFAMAQTETTFAEYRRFAEEAGWALPDDYGWGHGQQPLINVSWVEAKAYAAWLSEQTGFRYRLPTEAEWEYAARAGTTTPFIAGNCLTPEYANLDFRARSEQCPGIPVNAGKAVAVAGHKPNPWGLHNLYGNVREWVRDCWEPRYDPLTDGRASFSGEGGTCGVNGDRVLRGGAWPSPANSARTANRYAMAEQEWSSGVGFRLVRELD
ncbi:formylglycine-generating enzyme family protein [Marinimicrobium locisalis]|uniref:formylglycine-generating enzyme family protein n=1 Tax=Marinimicrobium locisalis TaxID=546022 RepID=UPI00322182A1